MEKLSQQRSYAIFYEGWDYIQNRKYLAEKCIIGLIIKQTEKQLIVQDFTEMQATIRVDKITHYEEV